MAGTVEQWQSSDHLSRGVSSGAEEQVNPKLGDKQRAALADLERWARKMPKFWVSAVLRFRIRAQARSSMCEEKEAL